MNPRFHVVEGQNKLESFLLASRCVHTETLGKCNKIKIIIVKGRKKAEIYSMWPHRISNKELVTS